MDKAKGYKITIIVLSVLILLLGIGMYFNYRTLQHERRQITKQDAIVQTLNKKLGIAESDLVTQKELNERALGELQSEVRDLMREHHLKLQSRDETIASLKNKIKGGKSETKLPENLTLEEVEQIENLKISYKWTDKYNRFHLLDPSIFEQNDEEFTSQQYLKMTGYVLQGKDGALQTRKVDVEELYQDGVDKDGKPILKKVPGSTISLVDAKFIYVDPMTKHRDWYDIFRFRPFAFVDSGPLPGVGLEVLNFGHWVDYANVGLSGKLAMDFTDPAGGSMMNSRAGFGVQYHFLPPLVNTNFAVGASISWPFNDLQNPVFTADLIFYLTDALKLGEFQNGD